MITDPNTDTDSPEFQAEYRAYLAQENRELLNEVNTFREFLDSVNKDYWKLYNKFKKARDSKENKNTIDPIILKGWSLEDVKNHVLEYGTNDSSMVRELYYLYQKGYFDFTQSDFKITLWLNFWSKEILGAEKIGVFTSRYNNINRNKEVLSKMVFPEYYNPKIKSTKP